MLFRRKDKADNKPAPHPGSEATREGMAATLEVAQAAAEALALRGASRWDLPVPEAPASVHRAQDRQALLGLLEGFAAMGLRTAGFTDGPLLEEIAPGMAQLAARRQPLVLHHLGRPAGEEAAFDAFSNSGAFLLYAATAQEAVDFALVAHRLAETALSPGLCVQDAAATGASLQSLLLPDAELVDAYLGRPGDVIASPTPAQEILFGTHRRRLPVLLDLDRPLGVGVTYEPYTDFLARAAASAFFLDHLGPLADDALAHYGALTGRRYARVQGYELEDADYVVIAEGAAFEPLQEVVDYLRNNERIRAGLLKMNMRRPFPGPRVAALLKGRKGVAVVARARPGLGGESTLLRDVRAALDRAAENGRSQPRPYPAYEAYDRPSDRPPLFEALYGDELVPPFAELCAVYMNMLPDAPARRHVFLGVSFQNPGIRLPKVERLQQRLHKGYPDLGQRTLPPVRVTAPENPASGLFALVAEADDTTSLTGKTFAQACQTSLDRRIRTHTNIARLQSLRPGLFVTAHAPAGVPLPSPARAWDAAVVTSPFLWSELHNLEEGGLLITHWDPDQAATRKSALAGSLTELHRKNARLFYLDAHALAADLSSNPRHHPLLILAALLGAFVELYPSFDEAHKEALRQQWLGTLTAAMDVDKELVEWLHQALEQGAERVAALPTFDLVEETSIAPEQEAPWTVQAEQQIDGSLYDLGRFWDSTGYLFESGRQDRLLADPFLATETLPARSSAIHDHAPLRDALPRLLADRCTGCGTCWTACPDSALPVTIQDLDTLIETTFDRAKAEGHTLLQLQRLKKHLAPQAHNLFAQGGSEKYPTLEALLYDAFAGLLERMKPGTDQQQTLEEEFAVLHAAAAAFPLVKTDTFFDAPEGAAKGSGLAFSLVVNPDACKACGLCAEVCPEDALEMGTQTPDRLAEARERWRFLRRLPDASPERIAPFIREDEPGTLAFHLLNRRAYHAVLGGDLAEPGSGMKTAVHLLAGLVEATSRPRVDRFVEQVSDLLRQIEQKIDAKLHDAVQVEDLAALGEKLAGLKEARLDLAELAPLLKEEREDGIDRAWLAQLTDAYRQLNAVRRAYVTASHGEGRARMVMGLADSAATRWARTFPHNPYPFPWICYAADGASGLVEGVYEGAMRKMAEGFGAVRKARLYLENKYDPKEHDAFFARFGRHDFTDEEHALCPLVLVLTSQDAGSLDHLVSRGLPVKVLVLAEANTLARHPGTAPARSTALAAVTYPDTYVLQSSIGVPEHLLPGFLQGLRHEGPAVFYVYAPSPSRDGIAPREVVRQAHRAVTGRAFPLFTFDPDAPGAFFDGFDLAMNPDPDADWPREAERATEDGAEAPEAAPFTFADWALHEGLFRHHFTPLTDPASGQPEGDGSTTAVPLSAYLDLPERERTGKVPVVQQPGTPPQPLAVSDEMVALTAWHRARWRLLQALPGHRPVYAPTEAQRAAEERREALKYHALLTQKLLALSGFAPPTPASADTDPTAA